MIRSILPVAAFCLLASTPLAEAQPPGKRAKGRNSDRFLQQSPKIGDTLPNVQAYDADGNRWSLAKLKRSYTVLVFGCLT